MRTVPTFRRTSKVSSDPTLSDKKRNSYAAAMMDSRLQAGTEGEGAPLMSWKSTAFVLIVEGITGMKHRLCHENPP